MVKAIFIVVYGFILCVVLAPIIHMNGLISFLSGITLFGIFGYRKFILKKESKFPALDTLLAVFSLGIFGIAFGEGWIGFTPLPKLFKLANDSTIPLFGVAITTSIFTVFGYSLSAGKKLGLLKIFLLLIVILLFSPPLLYLVFFPLNLLGIALLLIFLKKLIKLNA